MAIPNGANARRAYPEEAWEAIKPRVIHYYIDQGQTLDKTMDALREEGFNATEKMYKTRIKRWGLKKYIKDEDAGHILQAEAQDAGFHRAHTIGGRTVTAEDARRHLKRKKLKTWSGFPEQPEPLATVMYSDHQDILTSPVTEQSFSNGNLFPDATWMNDNYMDSTILSHQEQSSDEDIDMDDATTIQQQPPMELVRSGQFQVLPNLLANPNLAFATQSFLFGMRDFCDLTLNSIPSEASDSLSNRRFNELWDLFCTKATHMQHNRVSQALVVSRQAQHQFSNMLAMGDPWLLISLCLLLNDNMSNPDRAGASSSFLRDMASWAANAWANHPIAQLIHFLGQTNDRGLFLLEATVRMLCERLKEVIGPHHGVSLELARLHSRIMTDIGMHGSAEQLLSHELAEIEDKYGSSSLQNLLRLSSLARCRFMANEYSGSLRLYQKILHDPLTDEAWLADIKYGAMYFVAKSSAQLGRVQDAIDQAKAALTFSLKTKGPDHYWANNAKELKAELELQLQLQLHHRFEMIE